MDFLKVKEKITESAEQVIEINNKIKEIENQINFLETHPLMIKEYRSLSDNCSNSLSEIDEEIARLSSSKSTANESEICILEQNKANLLKNLEHEKECIIKRTSSSIESKKITPLRRKRFNILNDVLVVINKIRCECPIKGKSILDLVYSNNSGTWDFEYAEDINNPSYYNLFVKRVSRSHNGYYDPDARLGERILFTIGFNDEDPYKWLREYESPTHNNWTTLYFYSLLRKLGVLRELLNWPTLLYTYNGRFDDYIEKSLIEQCKDIEIDFGDIFTKKNTHDNESKLTTNEKCNTNFQNKLENENYNKEENASSLDFENETEKNI